MKQFMAKKVLKALNVMKSVEGVQDITLAAIHAGRLHQRFKKGLML